MSDITVIIPTNSEDRPRTCDSVSDEHRLIIVRVGNRSQARNYGARWAEDGSWLVFADDDIDIPPGEIRRQVDLTERGEVAGLVDYDFGLLLSRFMVVHRDDFWSVGGFDPHLNHMEDTRFCLVARRTGLRIRPLPRKLVDHEPHENGITRGDRVRALVYCSLCHPRQMLRLLPRLVGPRPTVGAEQDQAVAADGGKS